MDLIDTKTEQLSAIVNTYQALGGGVLTIPTPADFHGQYPYTHTVRSGENFWTISLLYYRSTRYGKALWAANKHAVPDSDRLTVGDKIIIPPVDQLDPALIEEVPGPAPPIPETVPVAEPANRPPAPASAPRHAGPVRPEGPKTPPAPPPAAPSPRARRSRRRGPRPARSAGGPSLEVRRDLQSPPLPPDRVARTRRRIEQPGSRCDSAECRIGQVHSSAILAAPRDREVTPPRGRPRSAGRPAR